MVHKRAVPSPSSYREVYSRLVLTCHRATGVRTASHVTVTSRLCHPRRSVPGSRGRASGRAQVSRTHLPYLQWLLTCTTQPCSPASIYDDYHLSYHLTWADLVATTELNIIFYLESIRPIRTAETFEAVEWATGFANKHGCIVGLLKENVSVFVKVCT